MQLNRLSKLSFITATIISSLQAEDSISMNFLYYSESDDRVEVIAPSVTVKHDFGTDYSLTVNAIVDSISGATPTWQNSSFDGSSGASKKVSGKSIDTEFSNVEFDDTRKAFSSNLVIRRDNRDEITVGGSYSSESDFYGSEVSLDYLTYLDDSKNRSFSIGTALQYNQILRQNYDSESGASVKEENTAITIQSGLTQIIDSSSTMKLSVFGIAENGYLDNNYKKIIREYSGIKELDLDSRPDSRSAYGGVLEYKKAFDELDNLITVYGNYRLYSDDWGVNSHTLNGGLFYEYEDSFIFHPALRLYKQSKADFYKSGSFKSESGFGSSDERLSEFIATSYKFETTYIYSEEWSYNIGLNYYDQDTGLSAFYTTFGLKYLY